MSPRDCLCAAFRARNRRYVLSAMPNVRLVEPVAGVDEPRNVQIIRGPFLDLEEAASVDIDQVVGFLLGPLAGHGELTRRQKPRPHQPGLSFVASRGAPELDATSEA